jgi:hypothetical protein
MSEGDTKALAEAVLRDHDHGDILSRSTIELALRIAFQYSITPRALDNEVGGRQRRDPEHCDGVPVLKVNDTSTPAIAVDVQVGKVEMLEPREFDVIPALLEVIDRVLPVHRGEHKRVRTTHCTRVETSGIAVTPHMIVGV